MAEVIGDFLPTWNSTDSIEESFDNAVDFAMRVLARIFNTILSKISALELVNEDIKNNLKHNVLVLDKALPWVEPVLDYNKKASEGFEIDFVVYHSKRGGWNAQVVPVSLHDNTARVPFPLRWGSLRDKDLQEKSGIDTAIFCHKDLFLFCAKEREDAILGARKASILHNTAN